MNGHKYHIVEQPVGWIGLLGTEQGLRRLSLKPSPQEALDAVYPSRPLTLGMMSARTKRKKKAAKMKVAR